MDHSYAQLSLSILLVVDKLGQLGLQLWQELSGCSIKLRVTGIFSGIHVGVRLPLMSKTKAVVATTSSKLIALPAKTK
jgi:hypothetical protein